MQPDPDRTGPPEPAFGVMPMQHPVDGSPGRRNATGPAEPIEPCLRAQGIPDRPAVHPGHLSTNGERKRSLEYPLVPRIDPRLPGQATGIAGARFRRIAPRNAGDGEFVDVRMQALVEAGAQGAILEDRGPAAGGRPDRRLLRCSVRPHSRIVRAFPGRHGDRRPAAGTTRLQSEVSPQ